MARIVDAIGRYTSGALTCLEAASLLGMSERHFRRLRDAYAEGGAETIVDRRRGKPASNKVDEKFKDWVVEQYVTRYFDFTPKHFHEELKKNGFDYGYTWTKSVLYLRGVLKPAKKRGAHRKKRPRSPLPGMLVFQDGSTHDWFMGRRAPCDLIVTLDDATGALLSAFFVEQEGTMSSFVGLRETIARNGLFSSFYTDRGSHYFLTPQANGKVDKVNLTQVGRFQLPVFRIRIDRVAVPKKLESGESVVIHCCAPDLVLRGVFWLCETQKLFCRLRTKMEMRRNRRTGPMPKSMRAPSRMRGLVADSRS
jgi:transposase